jgi:hypothetical protein
MSRHDRDLLTTIPCLLLPPGCIGGGEKKTEGSLRCRLMISSLWVASHARWTRLPCSFDSIECVYRLVGLGAFNAQGYTFLCVQKKLKMEEGRGRKPGQDNMILPLDLNLI